MENSLLDETRKIYLDLFGEKPEIEAWGPGRVNLIGEHTDYNEGYVLPLAVDRGVFLIGKARQDGLVVLCSADYQDRVEFSSEKLQKDVAHPWADYFKGVLEQFKKRGVSFKGCQAVLKGNLPQGAGLSSSASLEVASAVFLEQVTGYSFPNTELVKAAQAAENQFVGVQCGIMDQFVSYYGKEAQALWIDCRNLDYQWVGVPSFLKVVVCNTGVKRRLAASAYNKRREECEAGVQMFSAVLPGIHSLRDVTTSDFKKHQTILPMDIQKRCRHVIFENQRVLDTVQALKAGDTQKIRKLLLESHDSLRDDYEVSCAELDLLVEVARKNEKVVGGRMTGAGFGGCTVNLVPEAEVENFRREASEAYGETFGKLESYVFSPADGAKYYQAKHGLK